MGGAMSLMRPAGRSRSSTNVEQGRVDALEGGPQLGQKTLPRLRHRDRPRRACQEADLEALFEGLHGVTHGRAADAEPDRGLGEAALLRDDGKDRERAQVLTRLWNW